MPTLLVFTVDDRPRHVAADRAMATLMRAFAFTPVVYRESRGRVVTFHAEIPDLQLEHLPRAVEALRALDEVESIAVVPLPGRDEEPAGSAEEHEAEVTCGDGESVGHQT